MSDCIFTRPVYGVAVEEQLATRLAFEENRKLRRLSRELLRLVCLCDVFWNVEAVVSQRRSAY